MQIRAHSPFSQGFTLIELMIVVAIVAIMAMVAVPSYRSHVCKVERNQAKGDVLAFAQALESFYTANNFSYLNDDDSAPSVYPNYSPADGAAASKRFDLTLTIPSGGERFSISAQRSSGSCADGTLTLTSAGIKTWVRGGVTQNDWDE